MASPISHTWQGVYPITDPDHSAHLETAAALKEFHHNMPRHKAEEEAHKEYQKDQLHEAGAHHLLGMKASLGAGDHDSAKKHGTMYALILRKLGHPIVGEPPPEIADKAKHMEKKPYKFKAHKADAYVIEDHR